MRKPLRIRTCAAAVAALLVLAACGGGDEEPVPSGEDADSGPEELLVVATTTILGDLVRGVVGDEGSVTVLLPVGADPHDYQPSSQDGVMIREADLVVANGLGLEESLIAVFESARDDGARVLEVGELVDPMQWGEGGDHDQDEEQEGDHDEAGEEEGEHHEDEADEDEEGEHDEEEGEHGHEGSFDPHFWFDPSRVQRAVQLIAAELAEVGKVLTAAEWTERGESYASEIGRAADQAREILSAVPHSRRKMVTNHDSFSYFGDYFEFEVLDSVLPGSGLAQADTARLARLVQEIRAEQVTTLFTETIADAGVIMTVANEFNPPLAVVELYTGSLGPPGSDADTYPKWLVENARRVAEALAP